MGLMISVRSENYLRVQRPGLHSLYMMLAGGQAQMAGLKRDNTKFMIIKNLKQAPGELSIKEITATFDELLAIHREDP